MRRTAMRFFAGGLVAATVLTACSSKPDDHVAPVATNFTQEAGPSTAPVVSPSASSPAPPPLSGSVSGSAGAQPSNAAGAPSPTPCPVAYPLIFVEGKGATTTGGGVTFSYLDAQRLCGGPDDVQFVTTGKKLETVPVTPSAVVKLLPSPGSTQALQVPVAALPAAMAANKSAPYYAITTDSAGAITSIEQYFHP